MKTWIVSMALAIMCTVGCALEEAPQLTAAGDVAIEPAASDTDTDATQPTVSTTDRRANCYIDENGDFAGDCGGTGGGEGPGPGGGTGGGGFGGGGGGTGGGGAIPNACSDAGSCDPTFPVEGQFVCSLRCGRPAICASTYACGSNCPEGHIGYCYAAP